MLLHVILRKQWGLYYRYKRKKNKFATSPKEFPVLYMPQCEAEREQWKLWSETSSMNCFFSLVSH